LCDESKVFWSSMVFVGSYSVCRGDFQWGMFV
jgi:hypothetical protein